MCHASYLHNRTCAHLQTHTAATLIRCHGYRRGRNAWLRRVARCTQGAQTRSHFTLVHTSNLFNSLLLVSSNLRQDLGKTDGEIMQYIMFVEKTVHTPDLRARTHVCWDVLVTLALVLACVHSRPRLPVCLSVCMFLSRFNQHMCVRACITCACTSAGMCMSAFVCACVQDFDNLNAIGFDAFLKVCV